MRPPPATLKGQWRPRGPLSEQRPGPQASAAYCENCHQHGHIARDCTNEPFYGDLIVLLLSPQLWLWCLTVRATVRLDMVFIAGRLFDHDVSISRTSVNAPAA